MSNQAIVQGTLKADGTLVVNQKLHLAPGPVLVTVQPMTPRQRGLADVIDEIRQGQQARSFQGRSAQEIEVSRQEGEADYEQRLQALRGQTKSGPAAGGS